MADETGAWENVGLGIFTMLSLFGKQIGGIVPKGIIVGKLWLFPNSVKFEEFMTLDPLQRNPEEAGAKPLTGEAAIPRNAKAGLATAFDLMPGGSGAAMPQLPTFAAIQQRCMADND